MTNKSSNHFGYSTDASHLASRIKWHIAYPYACGRYGDGGGWYTEAIDADEKNRRLIELAREENTSISAIEKEYQKAYEQCSQQVVRKVFGVTFYDDIPYELKQQQWACQSARRHHLPETWIEASYSSPEVLADIEETLRDIRIQNAE